MKVRKKPVVVEAVRLTETTVIRTREGELYGYPGDWLITGVVGEKYPISDEIFRATYEPVKGRITKEADYHQFSPNFVRHTHDLTYEILCQCCQNEESCGLHSCETYRVLEEALAQVENL